MENMESPWLTGKEGASYAKEHYKTFLKRLADGRIRSVKRGRKRLTTRGWIDDYLLGLEDTGALSRK